VTWRAVKPCCRAPFDFQSWMSLSSDAKPKCLFILGDPLVFEEARGDAVQICTCTVFSRAQPSLLESNGLVTTGSFRHIQTTFLTQPASVSAHTHEARTQPASVVSINHQKNATQPASFYTPRRNSDFVVRDFMNR